MAEKKSSEKPWIREISSNLTRLVQEALPGVSEEASPKVAFDAEDCLRRLLQDAVREKASDIHLDPGPDAYRIRLRVCGDLRDANRLSQDQGFRVIRALKAVAGLDPVSSFQPQEARLSYTLPEGDVALRLAIVPTYSGEKLSIRVIDRGRVELSLADLGFCESDRQGVERWLPYFNGMVLVAGPTGAGKTTTLYAVLHELKRRNRAIITIEDPIEYEIDGITQLQVKRQHGFSFETGLRSILRLDPDFILVGEIRDHESAQAAVRASASSHGVMSSLHCRDAASVVTALRNWGVENYQIASELSLVVAQRLVKRLCPKCRIETRTSTMARAWAKTMGLKLPSRVWAAKGCKRCRSTGFQGQTGVFEIWHKEENDIDLLLAGKPESDLRDHLSKRGNRTLLDDALEKVRIGLTTVDEVQRLIEFETARWPAQTQRRRKSTARSVAKKSSKQSK